MKLLHRLIVYILVSLFIIIAAPVGNTTVRAAGLTAVSNGASDTPTVSASSDPQSPKCPSWYGNARVINCWYAGWQLTFKHDHRIPDRFGSWQICGHFTPSLYPGKVRCDVSKSTSTTRSNTVTVTGGFEISYHDIVKINGQIQSVTHYSITTKTTINAGASVPVPGPVQGAIEWAPIYTNRWSLQLASKHECYFTTSQQGGNSTVCRPTKKTHYSTINTGQVVKGAAYRLVTYEWKPTHVSSSPQYYRIGNWQNCGHFSRQPRPHTVTCHIHTTVRTRPSKWTDIRLRLKTLSRLAGYDVMHTTSVQKSTPVKVRGHRAGRVQWAPGFGDRKVITETEEQCLRVRGVVKRIRTKCVPVKSQPPKYVTVEKYVGNEYRVKYD